MSISMLILIFAENICHDRIVLNLDIALILHSEVDFRCFFPYYDLWVVVLICSIGNWKIKLIEKFEKISYFEI